MSRRRRRRGGPAGNGPARKNGRNAASARHRSAPCPDCGAVPADLRLEHEPTCPIARGLEAVMAADRQFFDKNPGAKRYLRRLAPAEAADLRLAGVVPDGWTAAGHVLVVELGPGLRARSFEGVHLFPGGAA